MLLTEFNPAPLEKGAGIMNRNQQFLAKLETNWRFINHDERNKRKCSLRFFGSEFEFNPLLGNHYNCIRPLSWLAVVLNYSMNVSKVTPPIESGVLAHYMRKNAGVNPVVEIHVVRL